MRTTSRGGSQHCSAMRISMRMGPRSGGAAMHVLAAVCGHARSPSPYCARIAPACKVGLLRMQSVVEGNWATELFWFPLNGMRSARVFLRLRACMYLFLGKSVLQQAETQHCCTVNWRYPGVPPLKLLDKHALASFLQKDWCACSQKKNPRLALFKGCRHPSCFVKSSCLSMWCFIIY